MRRTDHRRAVGEVLGPMDRTAPSTRKTQRPLAARSVAKDRMRMASECWSSQPLLPDSCGRFTDDSTNHSAAYWPWSRRFSTVVRRGTRGERSSHTRNNVVDGGSTSRGVSGTIAHLACRGSGTHIVRTLPNGRLRLPGRRNLLQGKFRCKPNKLCTGMRSPCHSDVG